MYVLGEREIEKKPYMYSFTRFLFGGSSKYKQIYK